MRFISLSLAVIAMAWGCTPRQAASLSNLPGDDSAFPLRIGQGFNSVNNKALGNCIVLGALNPQVGNSSGQTAEYQLEEITTEEALRKSLNISASASFSSLTGDGSARMNYAQSVNKSQTSRYLMVHTRVSNQLHIADSFTYTASAQKLLQNGRSDAFSQECGDQFVYGYRTGGEFFAVLEFEFSSDEENHAFSAAVSGGAGVWKASASINESLSTYKQFALTHIKMFKQGGKPGLPNVSSIEDFSRNFDGLVDDVGGAPVNLELITKDYHGVEPITLQPNLAAFEAQRYVMEQLAANRDQSAESLNSIHYVESNPNSFETYDEASFADEEVTLNKYINAINDSAVRCFDDVLSGCKLPTLAIPVVSLPKAKNQSSGWKQVNVSGWTINYPSNQSGTPYRPDPTAPIWFLQPGLIATSLNGEQADLTVELSTLTCDQADKRVTDNGTPFDLQNSATQVKVSESNSAFNDQTYTQINASVKGTAGSCLLASFYNQDGMSSVFSLNDATELAKSMRTILVSAH